MARRVGPVKVRRYSLEFKLKAVKLSQLKGVEVQAVADALEIHPFMLSRWRKEARDGVLAASRVRQSMTRGGAPGENAHMESFFHSLKADLVHGRTFQTVAGLRQQLCRYVRYYNYQRLHSSLGYQSPVDYARRAA